MEGMSVVDEFELTNIFDNGATGASISSKKSPWRQYQNYIKDIFLVRIKDSTKVL